MADLLQESSMLTRQYLINLHEYSMSAREGDQDVVGSGCQSRIRTTSLQFLPALGSPDAFFRAQTETRLNCASAWKATYYFDISIFKLREHCHDPEEANGSRIHLCVAPVGMARISKASTAERWVTQGR